MKRFKAPTRPLRIAGAAFLLALLGGCAPMSPMHTGGTRPHPQALSKATVARFELIERKGLRVLLRRGSNGLRLSAASGLRLLDGQGGQLAEFEPGHKAQIAAVEGRLRVAGRLVEPREAELAPRDKNERLKVGGTAYRGRFFLRASGDSLLLVNELSVEEYLFGVLPSEVGASWPAEALKAQAVAARSYALFRAASVGSAFYDVDDSTRSQVYKGTAKEDVRTSQAVLATSDLVLTWKGSLAQSFFHANCGGHTADAATVWGSGAPYLRGVTDPFCEEGPHFAWKSTLEHGEVLKRLEASGRKLTDFGSILGLGRDASGRWKELRLEGEGGGVTFKAADFRSLLGTDRLRSTNFDHNRRGEVHEFEGRGWGHGVGLCQEGAQAMAAQGYRYREILAFYFPGAKVKKLVE